jgi:hypothetical protein
LLGGPWYVPDDRGGAGGLGVQLGEQLNDLIGLYYAGTYAVGFVGSSAVIGALYSSAVIDFTVSRLLQVGVGPSLDLLSVGRQPDSNPSAQLQALNGMYVGAQTRVGLCLGNRKAGKEGRFMLGLEVHPTFVEGVPVSAFVTIGGGSF